MVNTVESSQRIGVKPIDIAHPHRSITSSMIVTLHDFTRLLQRFTGLKPTRAGSEQVAGSLTDHRAPGPRRKAGCNNPRTSESCVQVKQLSNWQLSSPLRTVTFIPPSRSSIYTCPSFSPASSSSSFLSSIISTTVYYLLLLLKSSSTFITSHPLPCLYPLYRPY